MRTTHRLLIYSLLAASPALAQEAIPPAPLTVEVAVSEAVRRNPRITAVHREIAAAQAGTRAARALANPTLTFTPAITPGGSDEELLLQQPLELNGARSARKGIAAAQLQRAEALALVELHEVVFETKQAFYELARAQELRRLAEETLRFTEDLDRGTRRQAEEGLRPGIDRIQTEIEVTRARQRVTQARTDEAVALAALNSLMGRSPSEPAGQLARLTVPAAVDNPEALVAAALSARAELTAEQAAREEFRQETRLHRASGRPDLAPQFRAGSLTRGVRETGIGIALSLPILDYGGRRNRIRQAEDQVRARESRIEAVRLSIRQEVEQAIARVRGAEALIRDYEGGVLYQAGRLLEARQKGFTGGLGSLLDILEAQRTYRGVVAEYTNALADYAVARAALERATASAPVSLPADPGKDASKARKEGGK